MNTNAAGESRTAGDENLSAADVVPQSLAIVPESSGYEAADPLAADPVAAGAVRPEAPHDLAALVLDLEKNILDAFERKIAFDATKEKQIDRLHAELQGHRSDLVGRAIRPVFESVIRLHDDFGKVLDALEAEDPAKVTAQRLLSLLKGFHDDVELALEHNGVAAFRSEDTKFNPQRQRVARTVKTADASLVGQVAARIRPGFSNGDTLIERERVAVYVFAKEEANQSGEQAS